VLAGKPFDCDAVARALIRQLDEEYDRLCQGDLMTLEACWKWRLGLLGKPVAAETADGTHQGRLMECGWDGLELEQDGVVRRLVPEAVRQLREVRQRVGDRYSKRAGREGEAPAEPVEVDPLQTQHHEAHDAVGPARQEPRPPGPPGIIAD